jgi:HK97 family phage major capsid protein
VFIPFSIEIGQDWGGIQAQMAQLVQDAKDDAEATKFSAGSGTNEPQGLLTGAIADLYSLEGALGPRFRPRAQWIANRSVYNLIRQFDTGGGGGLWLQQAPLGVGLGNNVPRPGNIGADLLGYPANEVSAYTGAVASNNTILTLGDFRYFLIVDRIGMDVELVPHLFGTNRRPVGQRGLLFFWRNTSVVLSANAFRTLKVK